MTNKKSLYLLLTLTSLFLSLIFFSFVLLTSGGVSLAASDVTLAASLFSVLYFGVLVFFIKDFKDNLFGLLFVFAVVAALVYMRVSLLSHPSRDYNVFLSNWLAQMREMEGVKPLVEKIGDYNMPYLYFLFIISKLNLNDLILIKWFSCIFDFLAAIFMMKIVSLKTENLVSKISAFILTLALPTVLLNSAYWGQCDSILAALSIGAVYFFLKDKPASAIALYALAFSFKLQAIFMLPFVVVMIIIKKVNPLKLAIFPAVFLGVLVPALICGRPFIDCVRIYFDQAGQYPAMSLNSPSFWQIFENAPTQNFNMVAVMLTGIVFLSFIAFCVMYKDKLDLNSLVELAFLSSVIIPFFLPRMHDRYFFIADILSLGVFFYDKRKWYVPLITQIASLNCYSYYLFSGKLILPYSYATITLGVSVVLLSIPLVKRLNKKSEV